VKTTIRPQQTASYHSILRLIVANILAGTACAVAADTNAPAAAGNNIMDLSLDDLSKVEIKIASINAKPINAQPAVVSVITSKEIEATGAHDLKDILQLVPGFYFGMDDASEIGTGFRGIWAYEGKIQLLVDGIEMNEGGFGNFFPLDHYAAENIKQVEIIRGPGSATYGGTAELAVISITTKGAEQNGGSVSSRTIATGDTAGEQATASFGYQLTNDWRFSGNFSYSDIVRSDQTYVSLDGSERMNLSDRSDDHPIELNVGGGWKDLDLRFIYDRYHIQDPLLFGGLPNTPPLPFDPNIFKNDIIAVSAEYALKPIADLSITPKVIYKYEQPWNVTPSDPADEVWALLPTYQRLDFDLPATITINDQSSLKIGAHLYHDWTDSGEGTAAVGLVHPVEYADYAGYAQYDLDTRWANLTLGGRYENQSYSGGAFVPRVGLVKAWDRFHVKLLYNQAFRTPNVLVIAERAPGVGAIQNELTTGYESEVGYDFNGGFSLVGNLYFMRIKHLIGYNGTGYANGEPMSTEGAETQLRYNSAKLSASLGYAFTRATEQGVSYYSAAPALGHMNLEMPQNQVTLSATWHVTKSFDWNFSGVFMSERGAYVYPNPNTPSVLPSVFLINTFAEYRWRDFSFGVGIHNLFDQPEIIGQSYAGGSTPDQLMGGSAPQILSGRTFMVKVGFTF